VRVNHDPAHLITPRDDGVADGCFTTEANNADDIAVCFRQDAPYWLDADALLVRKDPAAWTAEDLIAAVSLYRGELLPGFYDEWTVLEREHLRALFDHKWISCSSG
jgi:hypothetical protein